MQFLRTVLFYQSVFGPEVPILLAKRDISGAFARMERLHPREVSRVLRIICVADPDKVGFREARFLVPFAHDLWFRSLTL